ncbi:MAG: hypothetical protein R2777_06070 [Chitinophagales bacterium]
MYGEAMLTMQADHRKSDIIKEAYRLLKKDGYYGIHELGLTPNTIDENLKADIQKQLANVIKVNAQTTYCRRMGKSAKKRRIYHRKYRN